MLSIESKNIFAILKKWLYAERDIAFRELISNASDAIVKLRDISRAGEYPEAEYRGRIDVIVDPAARTLTITDNGLGLTYDELDKYINNIAFSGATDFIERYRDQDDESIIGHFGVGFYSAFMVSDRVVIETRSYQRGETGVRWECGSDMAYTMSRVDRPAVGTSVILHLGDDSPYLRDPDLTHQAIARYFRFLRTEIHYTFAAGEREAGQDAEQDAGLGREQRTRYDDLLVNSPDPLWRKPESQVPAEQMKAFYRDYFDDVSDPLFWLTIESVDLGLRGIVFFRDTRNDTQTLDGTFDVYSRGVFIGRNPEGLIPKFVNLQSGIIDCDRLPLVVSRSGIREDDAPESIQELVCECLSQEVTLHLNQMFTTDRATYERHWPNIGASVKYGVLTDKIFASVMTRKVIFENLAGEYRTIAQYLAESEGVPEKTVLYASDPVEQAHYLGVFRRNGIPALILDHVIDQPLTRRLEMINRGVSFLRLDADLVTVLSSTDEGDIRNPEWAEALSSDFQRAAADRLPGCQVRMVRLRVPDLSVILTMDEASRRMDDLMEIYGLSQGNPADRRGGAARSLVINLNSPLIRRLGEVHETGKRELVLQHLVDLALLAQGDLGVEDIPRLIERGEALAEHYLRDTYERSRETGVYSD